MKVKEDEQQDEHLCYVVYTIVRRTRIISFPAADLDTRM